MPENTPPHAAGPLDMDETASKDIEKILEGKGIEVDRRSILIEEPIKHVGDYTVKVRVHPEKTVDLKLVVEGEE